MAGIYRAGVSMHIYVSPARLLRFWRSSSGSFYAYLRITGSALSSWEMVERAFPCVFTCHRARPLESGGHRSGVSMRIYVSPASSLELGSRRAGVSLRMYVQSALLARVGKLSSGRFHAYLRENGSKSDLKSFKKCPGTHPEIKWFNLGLK